MILRDEGDERDGEQGDDPATEDPTSTPTPEETPAPDEPEPTAIPEATETSELEPSKPSEEETTELDPSPTLEEPTPTTEAATPSLETSPVPESPVWTAISSEGDVPSARRDHSLVADGEGARVYLFGGQDDEGDFGDLWVYDAQANSWAQLTADGAGPPARFGHNTGFDPIRNQMIIFGGQAGSTFFNDVWIYDVAGGVWTEFPGGESAPEPRYGAAGVLLAPGDNLYISHGFTSSGRFDDTWFFQIDGGWVDVSATEGERPEPRCLMRMAADPDRRRLLMFGGQSDTTPFLGDFWEFNIESRLWNQPEASGPSARNLYSLVRRDDSGDLVLFGGASPDGPLADIWIFRPTDNTWEQLDADPGPIPRDGHDAAWLSAARSMLLFGGRADGLTNEMWMLTLP